MKVPAASLRFLTRRAASCALVAAVVILGAADARAFCRTVAQEVPLGYDPAVSGCFVGDAALDVYWKNLCVSYSMQKDASDQIALSAAKAVAAQAFAAWNTTVCPDGGLVSITATELEPPGADSVDCDEVQYNKYGPNQNVIVFRDQGWTDQGDSVNTLGLTTITYDKTDGEIFDADMEINSSPAYPLVPMPPAPAGSYDLLSIITHEAGHFLGLAHSADTSAVMYAFYHPGSTSLSEDDINGICSLDLPGGARTTTSGALTGGACCATPRGGLWSECAPMSADGSVEPPSADAPETPLIAACAAPATTAPSGGAMPPDTAPPPGHACSIGGLPGARGGAARTGVVFLGAALLALLRRRRTRPAAALATWLSVASAGAIAAVASDAQASVAVAVRYADLLAGSAAVARVTAVEQHAVWERGRIYTYTRVRVDQAIAGSLPAEAWIRTRGGVVGDIGQIVEGEATFAIAQSSLVFLRPRADATGAVLPEHYVVFERGQGQFAITAGGDGSERLARSHAGSLVPAPPLRSDDLGAQTDGGRLAVDVLHGRLFAEAARDIADRWRQIHVR